MSALMPFGELPRVRPGWFESATGVLADIDRATSTKMHERFGVTGCPIPAPLDDEHPFPLRERAAIAERAWLALMPAEKRAALTAPIRPTTEHKNPLPAAPKERLRVFDAYNYRLGYRRRIDLAPSYNRAPYTVSAHLVVTQKDGTRHEVSRLDTALMTLPDVITRDRSRGRKPAPPPLRAGLEARSLPTWPEVRTWGWADPPKPDGTWIDTALWVVGHAKLRVLEWQELQHTEHADLLPNPAAPSPQSWGWPRLVHQLGRARPVELLADVRGAVRLAGAELPAWADDVELWGWVLQKSSFADGSAGQLSHGALTALLGRPLKLATHLEKDGARVAERLDRYADTKPLAPLARQLFGGLAARIRGRATTPR